jgi:GNAT superfamily N-acetyltransferase
VSGFVVRDARAGDEHAILALLYAFAKFEKLTHTFRLTPEAISQDFMGAGRRVQCDVAEGDGTIFGVMVWYRIYGTFAAAPAIYLEDIYVDPAQRRRGIGRAFLTYLARRAVSEGVTRIDWAVLDWNRPAMSFYDRLGARQVDDWLIYRLTGEPLQSMAQG